MHPHALKAVTLVLTVLLLWLGLRWFERVNLYHPSPQLDFHPGVYGMPYEDVSFRAADGTRLHGWFVDAEKEDTSRFAVNDPPLPKVAPLPKRKDGPLVLVMFHGNAGNISHRIQKLRVFRGAGLSVLLFDYRGYGLSEGRPDEQGTYADGLAAVEHLMKERGIPQDRLVYYGESLGCAVALETALRKPPRALILESGFTSTADMGKEIFPFLPVKYIVRFKYDSISKIPDLRCPLLVMHSSEDDIVPYRMGRRLFAAAPEPKRFAQLQGGHNEGSLESPHYGESIRDFLYENGGFHDEAP